METVQRRELGTRERVRLIVALVVLAGFAVLSAGGLGIALHGRSETIDSLEHWRARLAEGAPRATGFDPPASRIRRLEAELDAVPERLFALGSVFVMMSLFVMLGLRALRRGRPLSARDGGD